MPGIELHEDANAGPARKERQEALAAMEKAVDVVPRATAQRPGRPAGPRVPQIPRHRRRRRASVQARLGARRVGRPGEVPEVHREGAAGHGTRIRQQGRPTPGRTAGADHLPDLRSRGKADRRRRSHPSAALRSRRATRRSRGGQVQEQPRDAHLLQATDALRAQLGEGRRHQVRARSSSARATPT